MINFKTKKHDPIGMGTAKEEDGTAVLSRGLTKREYFAAMICAGLSPMCIPGGHNTTQQMVKEIPSKAVALAEALIEELNK